MCGRIVVTATSFPSFGPKVFKVPFVYELARHMARQEGLRLHVSTPYVSGGAEREERDGLSIRRFRYGFTALCDSPILPNIRSHPWLTLQVPFLLVAAFLDLVRQMSAAGTVTIHAHWLFPQGMLAVLYRKLFRRKNLRIVVTSHGGDLYGLRFLSGVMRWVLVNVDMVTVVNSAMVEEVRRLAPELATPIRVLPMGVDTAVFCPERAEPGIRRRHGVGDGPLLLFVGRLAEKKGIRHLLEAMPAILRQRPDARLLVIGGGPLESSLRRQARDLGIAHAVVFAGFVAHDRLPAYFATADVFVGPSVTASDGDREGMPVAFMEAMSSGCVIVVSKIDGIEDLVRDGVTGYVVPPADPAAIADRVARVLSSDGQLSAMRQQAREHVNRHFDWLAIAQQYLAVLKHTELPVAARLGPERLISTQRMV